LALQLFNIVSFNRVAASVYAHAREGQPARARTVVSSEYRRFSWTLSLTGAIGLGVAWLWPGQPLAAMHIEPLFVVLFGAGVLLRTAADYAGLLLLAFGADNQVLRNQVVAVASGALILALGAWRFGLTGAVLAALTTPMIYLLLNRADVRRLG
jgi:O-antigen/teichoic acid export membrane protein